MNRLLAQDQPLTSPHDDASTLFESSPPREAGTHAHTVFAPLHYEPKYAYPALVWLHGPQGDERELNQVMPEISLRNYVGVAPRGTSLFDMRGVRTGYSWSQNDGEIQLAEQRVSAALRHATAQFNVHEQRIFLAGCGCGGTMALRLGLMYPERFAGVLSLGGRFPGGKTPLARFAQSRQLPLLIASGRDSVAYPAEQVCADLRLCHVAGMQIALRQYPGGDALTSVMLADLNCWIMEQINGDPNAD